MVLEAHLHLLAAGSCVLATDSHGLGLVALGKPAGIMSHPNGPEISQKSLFRAPYDPEKECYNLNGTLFFLLHRLDSPTSGILLGTFNGALVPSIRSAFQAHQIKKNYRALVKGAPAIKEGSWNDRLHKNYQKEYVRSNYGYGEIALTRFQKVCSFSWQSIALSELSLWPITGRTHQLRVQCALHGHPIVGDETYGDFIFNRSFKKKSPHYRMFLHASSLELAFQYQGKRFAFTAHSPVPWENTLGCAKK